RYSGKRGLRRCFVVCCHIPSPEQRRRHCQRQLRPRQRRRRTGNDGVLQRRRVRQRLREQQVRHQVLRRKRPQHLLQKRHQRFYQVQHLLVPWIRCARCGGLRAVPGQRIPGEQHHRRCGEHQAIGCRRHFIDNTFEDATTIRFNDAKKTLMSGNIGLNMSKLKVANGASFDASSDYGFEPIS
ncbi:unnamed protein product, partial [Laminaria digitata]